MKKSPYLVFYPIFLFFIGQLYSTMAWSIDFGQRAANQWAYQEYSITYTGYSGNPFDIIAEIILNHESGNESRATEMFYVGGDIWQFRLTPTQTGIYTFTTNSSITALNGHTGELNVSANLNPNERGFLSSINNRWTWESNQQVIIPQYVMWGGNDAISTRINEFADSTIVDNMINEFILGHGFTGFHTGPIARGWFNNNLAGQALVAGEENPDPDTFTALENLITKVYAAGGHIHFWAWGDQERKQTPLSIPTSDGGGLNGIIDRRLQRYIASRLGPIPGWSMGYGFDVDEWDPNAVNGHDWRTYMQGKSGWFHFLGSRPNGPNDGLTGSHTAFNSWNSGFDYSSFEHHLGNQTNDEVYDVFASALDAISSQPAFSEDRTRLGTSRSKDVTVEQTRDFMWASAMAGGIAGIWGDRIDGSSIPSRSFSNKEQLKTFSTFFHDNNRLLPDSIRANKLSENTNTKVLHSPSNDNYVLYRENTNSIQVNLSSATKPLSAVAVDTKKAYAEINLGVLNNSNQTITLPTLSNWAIAIGAFALNNSIAKPKPPTMINIQ